jgi:hypothetical protein
MDEGNQKCGSCGRTVPFGEMRFNRAGNKLICAACIEKERGLFIPGTTQTGSMKIRQADYSKKTQ